MDKQQWLNWRGIGSSDAPVIMKVSPWKTPYQLWEKTIMGTEDKDNGAMRRGREMEETARKCFEEKMGVVVFPKCIEHKELKWMTATLDGIDLDNKIMVEIKCPNKQDHFAALGNMVPEKYYPQLQHQLEVQGLDGMYYFSFDGNDGKIVEVARDQKYIDSLLKEEEAFHECVLNMEPPELTERDYIEIQDSSWLKVVTDWRVVKDSLNTLEEREETLRQQLITLANNRNCRVGDLQITKSLAKGAIEYSKIPQLNGVNLEQFRKKPYTKWRISAK